MIAAGWTHRIDLGRVNAKHFFNVASLGLSVEVARQLDAEVKRRWGVLGYPLILWRAIRSRRAFRARIRCDGASMQVLAMQISVGNGRHYGGGMTIAADAAIDDGALDLVSVAPQGLVGADRQPPGVALGAAPRVPSGCGTGAAARSRSGPRGRSRSTPTAR